MTVLWSDPAIKHLLGIFEYTSQTSKMYAERKTDRLTSGSEDLLESFSSKALTMRGAGLVIRAIPTHSMIAQRADELVLAHVGPPLDVELLGAV